VSKALVVDTNVASYIFKNDTRAQAYAGHIQGCFLIASFQTVAELWFWAESRGWSTSKKANLERFIDTFSVYPSGPSLSQRWGRVMAEGQSKGRPLSTADAWIAATALELDLRLVTHNPKDFAIIDHLRLITEA
jgi:predicted nucleic acid-binding protein